jgi:hypothetical protein
MSRVCFIFFIITVIASCTSKNPVADATLDSKDTLSAELRKEYPNSIYIGRVTGQIADSFKTNEFLTERDSVFKLNSITKSSKPIEIRFFTTNYWSDTSYCVILTYDTSFSLRGIKKYYIYDTITNKIENRKTVITDIEVHAKADSLFDALVENGVFSINMPGSSISFSKYPLLELTKEGFKDGTIVGDVSDGVDFQLEYKVDKYFDRIYMNNPDAYFKHNPDIQSHRRKYEVTKLMLSGLK